MARRTSVLTAAALGLSACVVGVDPELPPPARFDDLSFADGSFTTAEAVQALPADAGVDNAYAPTGEAYDGRDAVGPTSAPSAPPCTLYSCNDEERIVRILGGVLQRSRIDDFVDSRDQGRRETALARAVLLGQASWSGARSQARGAFRLNGPTSLDGDPCVSVSERARAADGRERTQVILVCQSADGAAYARRGG